MGRLYTVKRDKPDERDHIAAPSGLTLPNFIDLSSWLGPVKDQGDLGACTGFAFAGLREFIFRKFRNYEKFALAEAPVFSALYQYFEERALEGDVSIDGGAQSRTGMKALAQSGICRESLWPYVISKFKTVPDEIATADALDFRVGAYHRVPDLWTLKSVLASGYVASLGIDVYESFESDEVAKSGIVPMPARREKCMGGHEVLAYGYDDAEEIVRCRNSWGEDWGEEGNFTLPYDYFDPKEELVMDMWTAHLGKPWKPGKPAGGTSA